MNANVLIPLKYPTAIDIKNMPPENVRIVDNNTIRRIWDHPGVVGENDS